MESEVISLDELAKRTGYSLSAVSTSMKSLVNAGIVEKSRKPKSKKIYFYMQKSMIDLWLQIMKKKHTNILLKAKDVFPDLIKEYKEKKPKDSEKELEIIEDYYGQILDFEDIMVKFIKMLEDLQAKRRK